MILISFSISKTLDRSPSHLADPSIIMSAAATVLEAVPVPDTLQGQEIHTFKDDGDRNYSYIFNFEQVCFKVAKPVMGKLVF